MVIYLDESGDLGFSGGGSDHFIITFLCTDDTIGLKRAVRVTKKRYKLPKKYELKGSGSPARIKKHLLKELSKLDIEVHSIVMKKSNVIPRLRRDKNILYNYVLGRVLVPYVLTQQYVSITVDRRGPPVKLDEYLKCKVWYEKFDNVEMNILHADSRSTPEIQAVDVISYSIFRKYERKDDFLYKLIESKIERERNLVFGQ